MSNVRDLLKKLIKDDTVKEKKPWDGTFEETSPPRKEPSPVVSRPEPILYGKEAPEYSVYKPRIELPSANSVKAVSDKLDPDCSHQWQWKSGVKTCWLCGGPAPLDRRDASTDWRARVYGKKR